MKKFLVSLVVLLLLTGSVAFAEGLNIGIQGIGTRLAGFRPYIFGSWNNDTIGVEANFWAETSSHTSSYGKRSRRLYQYGISSRYYFRTVGPLKPYMGAGAIGGDIHYEFEYKKDLDGSGIALNGFIGTELPLHEFGLPYTTLFGGFNYVEILKNDDVQSESAEFRKALTQQGLGGHIGLKLNFSGLLF